MPVRSLSLQQKLAYQFSSVALYTPWTATSSRTCDDDTYREFHWDRRRSCRSSSWHNTQRVRTTGGSVPSML